MIHMTFVAGTYQPKQCGVAHYTAHLRQALAQHGIQSIVLTTHRAAQVAAAEDVYGVLEEWHVTHLLSLVRALHRSPTALLHIQHAAGTYGFDRSIFLLPLLLKLTGWRVPIVTTVHEYGWWEWQPQSIPPLFLEKLKTLGQQRGWWDREDGFLLTQSDAVITTNWSAEQIIHERLPDLKPLVHRIPIAANVTASVTVTALERVAARRAIRQQHGWSSETAIVIFFGFLHPVKGLETLLLAFKQVLAGHPHARLVLMGGVETLALPGEQATRYWQQLQDQITTLELETLVHLTGYLEQDVISTHLHAADVGVLPFNHGVTLKSGSLLAMLAHALPVIATRSDPPDPDLDDSNCVWLIPPKSVDSLVMALTELLTDTTLRDTLSVTGYQLSQQFSWSSITRAHLDIYHKLL
jgi:glycosyltransferase involved in cell wall biosynthesis